MKPSIDYSLYLVTDSRLMKAPALADAVEQSILGGCTLVQLREKEASSAQFYEQALEVSNICSKYQVPLIINDRLDIAQAVKAQGVHVGQSDLPAGIARAILGPDAIIGVSVSSVEEAKLAETEGADYLGVGAMFATDTKANAQPVNMEELHAIRKTTKLPIVVIGGINHDTVPLFQNSGIDGIAVVSAIIAQDDIRGAAATLKKLFQQTKENL